MSKDRQARVDDQRHVVDAPAIPECADDRVDVEGTRERTKDLAHLLELSYEPMFTWRLDGPIESWNAGAERLYGFPAEQAIGRSSHALLQTKFPIEFSELRSRLRNEGYWSGELRHICKEGREVVVDSRMRLVGGDIVVEANRDVTEIKALVARQAALLQDLSATAAKFEALFNQSGIFAGIMDLQGCLQQANDVSLRDCGYDSEQVLNRPFWETPWWRGSEHVKARIRFATDQARSGFVFREELRYWVADGSERIVDFAMYPIRDQSGAVMLLHPTGIDITERKRIEAALRESEQRLRWLGAIVESSSDAIISKDLDGIIASWNQGAERIFGYTADEAIGQPITILIPPDRQDEERAIVTRIERGEHIGSFETVRKCKDGRMIPISLTVSPVKNASGTIVGASKVARDITQRKRTEEKVAMLVAEAEHRSKNLLANVQAIIKLSRSDTFEDLRQKIEGRIQALANVHSLFVATRWSGAELSSIILQELAPYAERNGTRVRTEGPEILLEPNVAQSIAVALHELATNAAKYGALSVADGRLDITWLREKGGRLRLRWTETGGPPVQTPTRRGFGARIVNEMVGQVKGEARLDWRPEGLIWEITFQA